jgi:hypothetical protein
VVEGSRTPPRFEKAEDLGVQRPLPLVLEVVHRHRRDHGVEPPERRQLVDKVVLDELHAPVSGEAPRRRFEHDGREVHTDTAHVSAVPLQSRGTQSSNTLSPWSRRGNSSARSR